MSRLDAAGRLQKWSIMLGEHNITYRPRTSIKGQILADFLNEMPSNASQGESVAETQEEPWTLFTDSSSCVDGSGAGLILINPDGVEFTYALRFQFAASNNEAEYEALIAAKEDNMIKYLDIAKGLVSEFKTFSICQVSRNKNKKADALSKIASTSFAHLSKQVLVEVLETKSITAKEVTAVIEEEGPTWMMELVNYLKEGTLPEDEKKARKLRLKARQYELMEGILYKRSFLTPWLRCVDHYKQNTRAGESKVPDSRNELLYEVDRSKSNGNDYRRTSEEIRMGQYCMPLRYTRRNNLRQRPFSRRAGESKVPDSRNGLLHEVDRSKSGGNDYRRTSEEIRMGQYCMPLWYTRRNNLRQRNEASHAVAGGKLGLKWEGPYEVTDALGNGAYKLRPGMVRRADPVSSEYYAASLFLFSTTDVRRNSIRQFNLFLACPRVLGVAYLWIYRDGELRGAEAEVAYKLWSILQIPAAVRHQPAEIGAHGSPEVPRTGHVFFPIIDSTQHSSLRQPSSYMPLSPTTLLGSLFLTPELGFFGLGEPPEQRIFTAA
nr:reverse transcriptase domain-containing protein [Tanacetum cinerariifolium]